MEWRNKRQMNYDVLYNVKIKCFDIDCFPEYHGDWIDLFTS